MTAKSLHTAHDALSFLLNKKGAGIYIHIPFCKQACHYCDFHFSTSLKKKDEMIAAIANEISIRKNELGDEVIQTIYFGGGTPSVLSNVEIQRIIDAVYANFTIAPNPEITLEANPDDLSGNRIIELSKSPINRLSIGVQSFFEEDLKLMNRAHNAQEAAECIAEAIKHFDNISIDLIYGIPGMTNERWQQNIKKALAFGVPHISSYALTVEPKTALHTFIQKGIIAQPNDEVAQQHFLLLVDTLEANGFVHYELSNFGKTGYFSQNNTAYWLGKKYLGIGPSAHSYNGISRSWNIANNALYLKAIGNNELPLEREELTITDRYNEYIMTGLRTIWGVSAERVQQEFGEVYYNHLLKEMTVFTDNGLLSFEQGIIKTTRKGKFLADGIASDLFFINLE
ncbi:radical SAM family heme chaperone HemW [Flavobacterium salilacus subsp. salilacus]|uniref:radical SAM family heme chaperone HemW n=1 Tax=Flavobacterium TaxID=237 RepID=UPI001074C0E7|nr:MULTISPECIES: radical SAM family heme chaperone HemW [Flavobacterium]KAF2520069.1 radical SAM family heme chaperone HemW [Flavobacterium salilacus subsp. salilacus]MBE1614015.1 radical SAM family heme chaperone HemW [Flavobacterium sp. SaA2.13]